MQHGFGAAFGCHDHGVTGCHSLQIRPSPNFVLIQFDNGTKLDPICFWRQYLDLLYLPDTATMGSWFGLDAMPLEPALFEDETWIEQDMCLREQDRRAMLEHELLDLKRALRDLEHRHQVLLDSMLTRPESVWAVVLQVDNSTTAGFLSVLTTPGRSQIVLRLNEMEIRQDRRPIEYVLPNMPNAWTMQYVQPVLDAQNYHSMVVMHLHDGQTCSILFCTEFDRSKFDHMMRTVF